MISSFVLITAIPVLCLAPDGDLNQDGSWHEWIGLKRKRKVGLQEWEWVVGVRGCPGYHCLPPAQPRALGPASGSPDSVRGTVVGCSFLGLVHSSMTAFGCLKPQLLCDSVSTRLHRDVSHVASACSCGPAIPGTDSGSNHTEQWKQLSHNRSPRGRVC